MKRTCDNMQLLLSDSSSCTILHTRRYALPAQRRRTPAAGRWPAVARSRGENDDSYKRLWRDELAYEQKPSFASSSSTSSAWPDEAFLGRSMEGGTKERGRSRRQREREKKKGCLWLLVEKLVVADFFFMVLAAAWFLAGLAEAAAFDTSLLIDVWILLWPVLFKPALGFFMAGGLCIALSRFLLTK